MLSFVDSRAAGVVAGVAPSEDSSSSVIIGFLLLLFPSTEGEITADQSHVVIRVNIQSIRESGFGLFVKITIQ